MYIFTGIFKKTVTQNPITERKALKYNQTNKRKACTFSLLFYEMKEEDFMSTIKKKVPVLLLALFLLTALIPSAASASEIKTDDKAVIYVQVPQDWENPCVWAWDEDGNNAFEAWPGGETEADPANEGWYYAWIPTWANHVIINANEGSVQTDELILDGKNAWITVSAPDQSDISYEQQTTGDIPEYVEKFTVHAQVDASWENPCIWAWSAPDGTNAFESWPGYKMTAADDGWYSAKVPTWINSIIINANEGSVQTEDIGIDAAEVWVTVNADGSSDFSYTDPNQEAVANITVRVMAPSDWDAPCLWAWSAPDGTNVFSTWPGEALEDDQDGWLKKEIPGWVNSVIVNGNEGSVQTADISIDAGKDVWVVVTDAETYEVSYEEPEVTAPELPDTTPDTENPETNASDSSINPAVIVIIVIAAVILVAAVIVIVKRKQK